MPNPFNNWETRHWTQGFSWRPESVSFRTLNSSGMIHVDVREKAEIELRHDTLRAIAVPFLIGPSGKVEIASIPNGKIIDVPRGKYALVCEHGIESDDTMWCRLSFVANASAQAAILRADPQLDESLPLLLEAQPA